MPNKLETNDNLNKDTTTLPNSKSVNLSVAKIRRRMVVSGGDVRRNSAFVQLAVLPMTPKLMVLSVLVAVAGVDASTNCPNMLN